jgi:hypothetical protein
MRIIEGKCVLASDSDGTHNVTYGEVFSEKNEEYSYLTDVLRKEFQGKKVRVTIEIIE